VAIFPRSSWSDTIARQSDIGGLCLILDQDLLRVNPEQAMQQALAAGVRFFQYRSKTTSRRSTFEVSALLARIARDAGALFIMNDHADIAVAIDADGVHLGQDDLPIEFARKLLGKNRLIGISTHGPDEAMAAEAAGADYIGFGPLFTTATKDAGKPQGIKVLSAIRQVVTVPVIAIGGINQSNVQDAIRSGANGVAVISALLSDENITAAAGKMLNLISEVVPKSS
jgi:thiamine-phosphate pyrophosphorylase